MGNILSQDVPENALQVLEYSSWSERFAFMVLSKHHYRFCSKESFFHWLANRLAKDCGVYVPSKPPNHETWRRLFLELFELKSLWLSGTISATSDIATDKRFKINVYARFKPKQSLGKENETEDEDQEISLPLHQRLAMIRMSNRLQTNRQALKVLASEGGWFQKKWSNIVSSDPDTENKEIAPKFRARDASSKIVASVQSVDPGSARVVMIAPDVGLREFSFDGVFPHNSQQKGVYDCVARRLVMDLLNGYNATSIVYGQTGSGKTYSMFGPDEAALSGSNMSHDRGIVPRACQEIFEAVAQRKVSFGIEAKIAVSYVEIFGDQVSDLLRFGARCGHSKVSAQRFVLSGAAEQPIESLEDIEQALRTGEAQKRRAATAMNERSSRAHTVFILTLHQSCPRLANDVTLTSRLFLADLGGSEKVKKSKVEAGGHRVGVDAEFSAGFEMSNNMREAVYINLGLLSLKKCIEALNNGSSYVPYQDSKLTMLLSDGLGGDSKTSVIVCASMDSSHASETMASMRFGERCALIETEARNNATMLAAVLADLDRRIKALEDTIVTKERWEIKEEKRTDELAEEGTLEAMTGGVEIKKVAVLVGAEAERRELEDLLKQRSRFTGVVFDEEDEEEAEAVAAAVASAWGDDVESDPATKEISSSALKVGGGGGGVTVAGGGVRAVAMLTKQASSAAAVGGGSGGAAGAAGTKPRRKVMGYGLGGRYDASMELEGENERFEKEVKVEELPAAVRARGKKQWVSGEPMTEEQRRKLEEKAKKINRTKLVYAGFSF